MVGSGPLRGNHYEVLGLDPGAAPQRVEKAYRFSLEMYGDAALATYSLLDPQEIRQARVRIQEAYQVLSDPMRRREYDVGQGFADHGEPLLPFAPGTSLATPSSSSAIPSAPRVLPEPVTGASLRKFREERGISLRTIATTSKVGVRFLEYIEADRHSDLPAPVYLRGFLQEYARAVGLDAHRTTESYMARVPKQA